MIMNSWKADGSVNSPWLHPEATEHHPRGRAPAPAPDALPLHADVAGGQRSTARCCGRRSSTSPTIRDRWHDNDEMMVGADLLVAPVFEAGAAANARSTCRAARMARGWYDFWSGQYFAGGAPVTVAAPLDRLPLFVRAGAVLPTTDTWDDSALTEERSRARCATTRRWPGATAPRTTAELFEDDGLQIRRCRRPPRAASLRGARRCHTACACKPAQHRHWPLPYAQIRVVLPAARPAR